MRKLMLIVTACALTLAVVSCKSAKQQQPDTAVKPGAMSAQDTSKSNLGKETPTATISVTSTAFTNGATIPKQCSCEGKDMSPPLAWSGVPAAAKSVAMIMDDPDAPSGTWTHWIIWNIPPATTSLSEGMAKTATVAGMKQGQNSWPKTGYGGPCPPPGKAHRYYFTMYALDSELNLPDNANRSQLEAAMKGHILAQGQLLGLYARGGKN